MIAFPQETGADVGVTHDAAKAFAKLARMIEVVADAAAVDETKPHAALDHAGKIRAHDGLWRRRHGEYGLGTARCCNLLITTALQSATPAFAIEEPRKVMPYAIPKRTI